VIKFNYILHLTQNMDGTPMRNFYSQDGEAEILTPAMDWSVQSAFEEARTEFVKGPPSATAAHQVQYSRIQNWEWKRLQKMR
jgi:hypothetical protein